MATFATQTISGVRTMVCAGTDITSQKIYDFAVANPTSYIAPTKSTGGSKDYFYFPFVIQIGTASSGKTTSIWTCDNEWITIKASRFVIYGAVKQGILTTSGYPQNGGSFFVDNLLNDMWEMKTDSVFESYGSYIGCNKRVRANTRAKFYTVQCRTGFADSVAQSGGVPSVSYGRNQDISFQDSIIAEGTGVGAKVFSLEPVLANRGTVNLSGATIQGARRAFQLAASINGSVQHLEGVKIKNNAATTASNVGNVNFNLFDSDVLVITQDISNSRDIGRISFRYTLVIKDSSLANVQNAKVTITDEANTAIETNGLTNAMGKLTNLPSFPSKRFRSTTEVYLTHATYAGNTRTTRSIHKRYICSYLHNILLTTITVNKNIIDSPLILTDTMITETNPALVASYTDLNTAAKIYDALKKHLYDNYNKEIQTYCTREGNEVDFRNLNVVIDGTATVLTVSANSITIPTPNLLSNIKTTGLITQINNPIITGELSDSTGDSNFTINNVGFTVHKMYNNEREAVRSQQTGATDLALENTKSFRYQSSIYGGNTYYFILATMGVNPKRTAQSVTFPVGAASFSRSINSTPEQESLLSIVENGERLKTLIDSLSTSVSALPNSNSISGLINSNSEINKISKSVINTNREIASIPKSEDTIYNIPYTSLINNPPVPNEAVQSAVLRNGDFNIQFKDSQFDTGFFTNIEHPDFNLINLSGEYYVKIKVRYENELITSTRDALALSFRIVLINGANIVHTLSDVGGIELYNKDRSRDVFFRLGYITNLRVTNLQLTVSLNSTASDRVNLFISPLSIIKALDTSIVDLLDNSNIDIKSSLADLPTLPLIEASALLAKSAKQAENKVLLTEINSKTWSESEKEKIISDVVDIKLNENRELKTIKTLMATNLRNLSNSERYNTIRSVGSVAEVIKITFNPNTLVGDFQPNIILKLKRNPAQGFNTTFQTINITPSSHPIDIPLGESRAVKVPLSSDFISPNLLNKIELNISDNVKSGNYEQITADISPAIELTRGIGRYFVQVTLKYVSADIIDLRVRIIVEDVTASTASATIDTPTLVTAIRNDLERVGGVSKNTQRDVVAVQNALVDQEPD